MEVFQFTGGIRRRLILGQSQTVTLFFFFGFNDADRLSVYKKDIIGRSNIGIILANGDANISTEVEFVPILNLPACLHKKMINLLSRLLFRFHMITCDERLLEPEKLP